MMLTLPRGVRFTDGARTEQKNANKTCMCKFKR
jgi:hypothetical protein